MALTPTGSNKSDKKNDPSNPETSVADELLMREIDDAVRQDDAAAFFRKYGTALGTALFVGLAAFAGYLIWDNYREGQLEDQSEAIVRALDLEGVENYSAASDAVADLLDSAEPGVRTSARFVQANAALQRGEKAKAMELFAAIAADADAPEALRDLALIREVTTGFDDSNPQDVITRLTPMLKPDHAFYGSAAELVAMAHLELGNRKEAGKLFADIAKAEDVGEPLKARARQMAGMLGVDAIVDIQEVLEEQGVVPPEGAGEAAPE